MKENINLLIKIAFLVCFILSLLLLKRYLEQNKYEYSNDVLFRVNKETGEVYEFDDQKYKWIEHKY